MYIDYKKTVWSRIYIPKNLKEEIEQRIKEGEDLENIIDDLLIEEDIEYEDIYETESTMTPEENGGRATIEVFEDYGKCKYSNSTLN